MAVVSTALEWRVPKVTAVRACPRPSSPERWFGSEELKRWVTASASTTESTTHALFLTWPEQNTGIMLKKQRRYSSEERGKARAGAHMACPKCVPAIGYNTEIRTTKERDRETAREKARRMTKSR